MWRKKILALTGSFVIAISLFSTAHSQPREQQNGAPPGDASFSKLVDDFFDFSFQYNPVSATAAGFHQYDTKLNDYSRAGLTAETAAYHQWEQKLEQVDRSKLDELSAGDLDLMSNDVRAHLLDLESIRRLHRDPDAYTSQATYSIFLIMKRNYAPQAERLASVIARERQIPGMLRAARQNLKNPPRIYTQVALQELPGVIEFFQDEVAQAFSEVRDRKLVTEFNRSNAAVVAAFQSYQSYLKSTLLPASKGDFRIGRETYRKKLLYEEMVDTPLDRLLEVGYADLRKNQQQLKQVAGSIDPSHTPREVLEHLEKDHPPAAQLLSTFRNVLGDLRHFIEEKEIITIPSDVAPIVEDTPAFARALTIASMDTPGAYEDKATEAMFNVTLPEKSWSAQKVEDWMRGFNRGTIISTAVHEVYPGHYTQFLWVKQAPSKVRKLLDCGSNAEGWAHYTEQMMLDEGYGNHDPKLRVGQLQDALLRDARFIAGIEMHTGKMTMEQARQFFIKEGFQTPPVADVESKRGTSDPTYLVYTLGKLQIMKLREDYRQQQGEKFSLQEFHDRFMQQGAVPLKIIRKAMLGNDSPTL